MKVEDIVRFIYTGAKAKILRDNLDGTYDVSS